LKFGSKKTENVNKNYYLSERWRTHWCFEFYAIICQQFIQLIYTVRRLKSILNMNIYEQRYHQSLEMLDKSK
jgi:hypothetical protein